MHQILSHIISLSHEMKQDTKKVFWGKIIEKLELPTFSCFLQSLYSINFRGVAKWYTVLLEFATSLSL